MFHYLSIPYISPKHEHRLLSLVFVSLHAILWWGLTMPLIARALLFVHIILFILWQPMWRGHDTLSTKNTVFLSGILLLFIIFFNIGLLTLWHLLLIGLMGGRDLVKPQDRTVNIIIILLLILDLLIINVHQQIIAKEFSMSATSTLDPLGYILLVIPLGLLFIKTDDSLEYRHHIDFFHGFILTLLVIIIALGSLVITYYGHVTYPFAIFQISLIVISFVLGMSWLSMIFAGEESMNPLWIRHLLNIGNSFEQWLDNLAQPSNYKSLTPEQFLQAGFEQLMSLPWVNGIAWHSPYGQSMRGHQGPHTVVITVQSLEATIYSHYRISGNHYFHIKILIQLIEYFHQAKRREAAFAQQAHLQAIHEAGAKLTHDIKNLLQSLHAITSAIETCQPAQFGDTQRLLQGQMPHLTQRLKRTLDKLQKPAEFSYSNIPISLWWENLQARYRKSHIEFINQFDTDKVLIPEDLFDNVSENLLQNALMKRKREPNLHIRVSLMISKHRLQLVVCDDGSAIPEEIVANLLTQPVPSRDGFGIGLYQAVKQLAHTSYQLSVKKNLEGQVCFELSSMD